MSCCFRIHTNRPIQEEPYEPNPARNSTLGSPVQTPFLSMNAVAPATIEEIAARAGWPAAFAVAGGAAALSCLLSLRLRDRRPGAPAAQAVPGLRQMLVRPSLLRILLVVALASAAMGAAFTFHQLYALELGMRNVRAFFVAYTAAAIAVRVGLGHVADRAGRRRVSLLALFLYVAVVTGMPGLGAVGLRLRHPHRAFHRARVNRRRPFRRLFRAWNRSMRQSRKTPTQAASWKKWASTAPRIRCSSTCA